MEDKPEVKRKLYFSLFSGDIYWIPEDEIKNLDEGQIPLLRKPKPNCNKCYGRGFLDKDHLRGIYSMCKCLKQNIDFKVLGNKPIKVHTPVYKNA